MVVGVGLFAAFDGGLAARLVRGKAAEADAQLTGLVVSEAVLNEKLEMIIERLDRLDSQKPL